MKRVRVIVEGDVQGVRFRDYIQKIAITHNITGSVENMKDSSVEVICEGKESDIKDFIAELDKAKAKEPIKRYPSIAIEKITVFDEEPTGKFPIFEIKYGTTQEELRDQMGAAYNILLGYGQYMEKLDVKYGEISENLEISSKAITLLAETLKSDRDTMKNLANNLDKSMTSLSADIRSLISSRK